MARSNSSTEAIDKAHVRLDSGIVGLDIQDIQAAHLPQRLGNQPSAVIHLAEVGGDVAGAAHSGAQLFETFATPGHPRNR